MTQFKIVTPNELILLLKYTLYNNKTHDIPFAENCNEILHQHYNNEGLFLTQDIEYNDSCASQFVLTAVW